MRVDLFFLGATLYRVEKTQGTALFSLLQRHGIRPKALKRVKKTGDIGFYLTGRSAARFEALAREESLAFSATRGGLPVLLLRILRSPGLVAGVLLSLALFLGARALVWEVRIEGNVRLAGVELEQQLAECGLAKGSFLPTLDTDAVALSLRERQKEVVYAAVNVRGNVAYVQIREREPIPDDTPAKPANLVAKYDGVITMPLIFEGECLVRAGDVVRAGQILVSGVSDTQNHGFRLTRAAGEVLARTVHSYEVHIPLAYEEKVYTGEENTSYSLLFFASEQKVFENLPQNIDKCDIIDKTEWARLPTGEVLPFGYRTVTAKEYRMQPATRTAMEARQLACAELQALLARESAARTLLQKDVTCRVDSEGITLVCTAVFEENIAAVSEFEVSP